MDYPASAYAFDGGRHHGWFQHLPYHGLLPSGGPPRGPPPPHGGLPPPHGGLPPPHGGLPPPHDGPSPPPGRPPGPGLPPDPPLPPMGLLVMLPPPLPHLGFPPPMPYHFKPDTSGHWHDFGYPYFAGLHSRYIPTAQYFGQEPKKQNGADQDNWEAEADVFDTDGAYVVHVSLPGARREDVSVFWSQEKGDLVITGIVHRPGDEEFIGTLITNKRKTGTFNCKAHLGTDAGSAQVDSDGITAKLENGILFVNVPKLDGEFINIKKVNVE